MSKTITVNTPKELTFEGLKEESWSGAISTLEIVEEHEKEEELMEHLAEIYYGENTWDYVELNDYLWFELDAILEALGIAEDY